MAAVVIGAEAGVEVGEVAAGAVVVVGDRLSYNQNSTVLRRLWRGMTSRPLATVQLQMRQRVNSRRRWPTDWMGNVKTAIRFSPSSATLKWYQPKQPTPTLCRSCLVDYAKSSNVRARNVSTGRTFKHVISLPAGTRDIGEPVAALAKRSRYRSRETYLF